MIKVIPRYVDHLWYPILVEVPGSTSRHIVEMQGRDVNQWNDLLDQQRREETKAHPIGWCV